MIDKASVRIGSDFEFFLKNIETGEFVSAIPHNIGTKMAPEQLQREGCCIQRDGVLQECNVPPVELHQSDEFWENVEFVTGFLAGKLEERGLKLECCASATLNKKEMKDKEAMVLGCDADYNAWENGMVNEKPKLKNKYFRTCGCHFHLSYPNANADTSMELVKLFDLFVTVPFILIDGDSERRKLYGQAGSFRMQDWGEVQGVEFRQLSNKCLENSELIDFVFHQIDQMLNYINTFGIGTIDNEKEDIVNCINNSDQALAAQICERHNIFLPLEYVANGNLLETA